MVSTTGQAYAYTGDNPVNGVDPMGLCNIVNLWCQGQQVVGDITKGFTSVLNGQSGLSSCDQFGWATSPSVRWVHLQLRGRISVEATLAVQIRAPLSAILNNDR